MKRDLKHVRGAVLGAVLTLLFLTSCGSPYLYGKPRVEGGSVTETKFDYRMVFDCMRGASETTFTAYSLNTPMDDAKSERNGPYVPIAELNGIDPAFDKTCYITLDVTTEADGDTIKTAALTLRDAAGSVIRSISADGTINYLGAEGFVYISDKSSAGYFFSSTPRAKGESVTYTFTKELVTKKSELGWK